MSTAQVMLTPILALVAQKVLALRKISKDSGMITTRAQHRLLGQLSDEDLAVVAAFLMDHETQYGW